MAKSQKIILDIAQKLDIILAFFLYQSGNLYEVDKFIKNQPVIYNKWNAESILHALKDILLLFLLI